MANRITIVLLALISTACTRSNSFRTEGLTTSEKLAVEAAAADWCYYNNHLCATFDGGDNVIRVISREAMGCFPGKACPRRAQNTRSFWSGDTVIELADFRPYDQWLVDVFKDTRHELGHHFADSDDHLPPGNVMAEEQSEDIIPITKSDLAYAYDSEAEE
jgi:hypothetical protein